MVQNHSQSTVLITAVFCYFFSSPSQIWINLVEKQGENLSSLPKWWRPDLNTVLPTLLQVVSLIGIFKAKVITSPYLNNRLNILEVLL